MSIYIPFTYIIGWSQHKKFYYGAKYAQGCQPSDLWESYFTSSYYVKYFKEEFGEPDIIRIHRTFTNAEDCVQFENKYLTKIDARNNPLFLNKSNGCNSYAGSKEIVQKRKETCLQNWGYEHPNQSPIIREKNKKTSLENWGYEYPNQSPIIKEKTKKTNLKKYGVEFALQVPELIQQRKETCLELYGFENVSFSPIIKERKTNTLLENFGVYHQAKIKRICKYCGEYKNVCHEPKCKKNPNRKVPNKTGKENPSTKWFRVISPEGEIFTIISRISLIEFAKERGMKHIALRENKIEGWFVEEIEKLN